MGLWPYVAAGQTGLGHGGSIEGFRACVYYFPERKLAISYATNAAVLSMDEIVDESLALVLERGRKPPSFESVRLTAHSQAQYAGLWQSAEGQPDETPFRRFRAPDEPIALIVKPGADSPAVWIKGHAFPLRALGNDEFALRELGYFLRFDPREDDLVIRSSEGSYYLKRAE
jgi:D-alanyl-D-alanine carboxypeptidase